MAGVQMVTRVLFVLSLLFLAESQRSDLAELKKLKSEYEREQLKWQKAQKKVAAAMNIVKKKQTAVDGALERLDDHDTTATEKVVDDAKHDLLVAKSEQRSSDERWEEHWEEVVLAKLSVFEARLAHTVERLARNGARQDKVARLQNLNDAQQNLRSKKESVVDHRQDVNRVAEKIAKKLLDIVDSSREEVKLQQRVKALESHGDALEEIEDNIRDKEEKFESVEDYLERREEQLEKEEEGIEHRQRFLQRQIDSLKDALKET